ncbi:hypothetical protein PIB30_031386 [Stylosanthes scabra]|uniref:EF-hand domain-containing protein n=1 Tax=Stylosanthes scabra TaxID=79078 RepID=A0ABU6YDS9_9FABA|nr:hypothetical protein [Stylosanthes scabra]
MHYYPAPPPSPKPGQNKKAEIKKLLEKADKNKDGCYTKDELKNAFNTLGSKIPSWRTQFALWKLDSDGDGQISGDEINKLIDYIFDRFHNAHGNLK